MSLRYLRQLLQVLPSTETQRIYPVSKRSVRHLFPHRRTVFILRLVWPRECRRTLRGSVRTAFPRWTASRYTRSPDVLADGEDRPRRRFARRVVTAAYDRVTRENGSITGDPRNPSAHCATSRANVRQVELLPEVGALPANPFPFVVAL